MSNKIKNQKEPIVQKRKCSVCGRILYSIYPLQLKYNYNLHMERHEREQEEEE